MSNRRRLAREKLEIYLVYLLLAYRQVNILFGLLLLAYAATMLVTSPVLGVSLVLPAAYLILLGSSYSLVHFTARLGAWITTLWQNEDD